MMRGGGVGGECGVDQQRVVGVVEEMLPLDVAATGSAWGMSNV